MCVLAYANEAVSTAGKLSNFNGPSFEGRLCMHVHYQFCDLFLTEMQNIQERRKLKGNFSEYYRSLCAIQDTCPLAAITANLQDNFIDCNADRIRLPDWTPIFSALKENITLNFIALRSYWQQSGYNEQGISCVLAPAKLLHNTINTLHPRPLTKTK